MSVSMNSALLAGGFAGIVLIAAFAVLLRSLISTRGERFDVSSALPEVRVDKYKAMGCLLSSEDLDFLRCQSGYTPALGRRYKAERRRVMRAYLKALSTDFQILHSAAGQLLMVAPVDQPALASELMKQRWLFTRGLALAQVGLCLDAMGVGNVQVTSLVDSLSAVQRQYSSLSDAILLGSAA